MPLFEDHEQIVIGRGLSVLGADGGAVTPRGADGGWRITASGALGERVQAEYGSLPHDSPLPACTAARTGRRIELPTVGAGLAHTPLLAPVYEETGRRCWVFLPLIVNDERLGSLSVSWVEERELLPEDRYLLEGFTAQSAQTLGRSQARDAERRAAAADRTMSETLPRWTTRRWAGTGTTRS